MSSSRVDFRIALLAAAVAAATVVSHAGAQPPVSSPIRQLSATASEREHALAAAIQYVEQAAARAAKVPGYTARMVRVNAKSGQTDTMTVDLKLRTRPFSVYMRFAEPAAGREVLYIDGWNRNRLIAHEGSGPLSLVGTISLDPNSPRALRNGGRPITQAGIAFLARGVADEWREAMAKGIRDDEVSIQRYPDAQLGDVPCEVLEVTLARPVTESRQTTLRLFLDRRSNLPIAMQAYGRGLEPGAAGSLIEEVRYLSLDVSRVPTAVDFDPRNPAYDF